MSESGASDREAGFLAGIGESIRAHVDERLKSPFAGAVVLAFLVLHWDDILLLAFSSRSIEARIAIASENVVWWQSVGTSVLLAFGIAIGFYLLSATFLVIVELYEWLKGRIERGFDAIRWVSPTDYMASKRRYGVQIRSLQDLASDNLAELDAEKERVQKAAQAVLQLQEQLGEARSLITNYAQEKSVAEQQRSDVAQSVNGALRHLSAIADRSAAADADYQRVLGQLKSVATHLEARNDFVDQLALSSIDTAMEELRGIGESNKDLLQRASWLQEELEKVPGVQVLQKF